MHEAKISYMERQQDLDFINWHGRELLDYGCEIINLIPTNDWLVVCGSKFAYEELFPTRIIPGDST